MVSSSVLFTPKVVQLITYSVVIFNLKKLGQKDNLSNQMRSLEQFLYEIDRDITQSSKSRFISRSAEIQESIEEVNCKVIH